MSGSSSVQVLGLTTRALVVSCRVGFADAWITSSDSTFLLHSQRCADTCANLLRRMRQQLQLSCGNMRGKLLSMRRFEARRCVRNRTTSRGPQQRAVQRLLRDRQRKQSSVRATGGANAGLACPGDQRRWYDQFRHVSNMHFLSFCRSSQFALLRSRWAGYVSNGAPQLTDYFSFVDDTPGADTQQVRACSSDWFAHFVS